MGKMSAYLRFRNSMAWGKVQYLPFLWILRYHIILANRMIGDSTKKSPCLEIHVRFKFNIIV